MEFYSGILDTNTKDNVAQWKHRTTHLNDRNHRGSLQSCTYINLRVVAYMARHSVDGEACGSKASIKHCSKSFPPSDGRLKMDKVSVSL
ncbi:hypothetical protein KVV02_005361 [Mortierella alpina]|uniref:Uncharacterized protein n=1 Tax=Mortierella alpina TaxID=64518 RepID=A0A9P8A6Z5_MORAP|nr:hypothetical protein KVV02_005361 [Mortierella alpina]